MGERVGLVFFFFFPCDCCGDSVFKKYLFIWLCQLWHARSISLTRDQAWAPPLGAWSLSHWVTREVPGLMLPALSPSLGPCLCGHAASSPPVRGMAGVKADKAREVEVEERVRQGWLHPRAWCAAALAVGYATTGQRWCQGAQGLPGVVQAHSVRLTKTIHTVCSVWTQSTQGFALGLDLGQLGTPV